MHGSVQTETLSAAEVVAALKGLMDSPSDLQRLYAYGARLDFSGMRPEDLVQEALARLLGGERSCPSDVSIAQVVKGVMRSIANSAYKKQQRFPVLELVPSHGDSGGDDGRGDVFEGVEPITAEQILASRQSLSAVHALFDADPVAKVVLEGMEAGFEGADLCQLAGIETAQLATIRKRISRRLQSAFPKGSET